MNGWRHSILWVVLALAPFISASAFAMDIYVPATPGLMQFFHTTAPLVQLTLSLFLLANGLGQLAFGPIADRFGCKLTGLLSSVLYLLGTLFCMLATSIHVLIMMRVMEGLGACGMQVCAFATVRQLFPGEAKSAKVYSYLNSTIGLSPLAAPIIGGYLIHWFDWRAAFGFLIILGMLALILSKFIFSTPRAGNIRRAVWPVYRKILSHPVFWRYAMTCGAGMACFFCFFSSAPVIIIKLLQVPEQHFGYYFGFLGLVIFFGSVLNARWVTRYGVVRMTWLGIALLLLGGLMMYWVEWQYGLCMAGFLLPMLLSGVGSVIILGAGAGGAMHPFMEESGSAAALLGSGQFIVAAVAGTLLMHKSLVSTLPVAISFIALALLAAASCLCFRPSGAKAP